MKQKYPLPIPVKTALKKLGHDLRVARVRRRITMELMAKRAAISRATLTRVEKGDPTVSFGTYASIIFILGMISNLVNIVDISKDELGLIFDEESLPKRVRIPRRNTHERT